ncbi:hypothetical protein HYU50_02965 [Candidatus Woesearchaeota archaeon]|nr:hypothetical protein [Candidatus Woesearchaeota archaeon]
MRKELFLALMVISMFLISACDVYNTLYVKQPAIQGEAVEVPEVNITLEIPEEGAIPEEEAKEIDEEMEAAEEIEAGMEEKPEAANVIIVAEGEKVSLTPKAEDPDNDKLTFTFTSPLDSNGQWQTTYGDVGEYTVTITASDGTLTASKEVLIIVKKKEEAPVFERFKPIEAAVAVEETEAVDFEVVASDLNKDELSYEWKLDGVMVGDEDSYTYQTTYDDSGSHTVKAKVTDRMFDTEKIWAVTVENVNRKPVLETVDDINVEETDRVVIELKASDSDGDDVSYSIDNEKFLQDGNTFTWKTTYDDAGEYTFTVSASDGVDTASQQVKVAVENVNRPPMILDIVQK